jgi:hypothetical protein
MGLKRGESARKLARIRVVSVRREPLFEACESHEPAREGFPHMTGAEFVEFFCASQRCDPMAEVTRIEFKVEEILV